MKENIINIIRAVPISGKTYEEYVEAVADRLCSEDYRKASDVAREFFEEIEQVQKEIVYRMQEFINEWKQYSESTDDYFGGKYDAMEIASRIVKSILTFKTAELRKKYMESERWEANLQMLESGALGDDTLPKTLLRYWQMQESAGYPNACENVKYFEDMLRRGSEDTE